MNQNTSTLFRGIFNRAAVEGPPRDPVRPFFLFTVILLFSLPMHTGFGRPPESPPQKAVSDSAFSSQRDSMVKQQLEARGIRDPRVLRAMNKVKRHLFVPTAIMDLAYEDTPLPIGRGQTISQPYVVAAMTEALTLGPEDRVLEIGTGSGYQAAILAEMVKEVYSIEIVPELAASAKKQLQALGYSNVKVKQGDGYEGWAEHQPFDAIVVTAAPEKIPQKLLDQLKNPGGRMVVPVGSFDQELLLILKTKEGLVEKKLFPVRFVPMVKKESGNLSVPRKNSSRREL